MHSDRIFLIDFIKRTVPVTDAIAGSIAGNFEPATYSKNDYLLKQGTICNDYIFLERGFARAFTYDMEEHDVTTDFYAQHSIIFEVASYFKRTPTQENIQALTNCIGWRGNYDNFQILFHSIPEFREFGRAILVNGFISLKERMLSMINATAEQRYEQLVKTKPEILYNAPLKYIASYLGITDTSLSRIRKEISQK